LPIERIVSCFFAGLTPCFFLFGTSGQPYSYPPSFRKYFFSTCIIVVAFVSFPSGGYFLCAIRNKLIEQVTPGEGIVITNT
jgi:hypothetical protein